MSPAIHSHFRSNSLSPQSLIPKQKNWRNGQLFKTSQESIYVDYGAHLKKLLAPFSASINNPLDDSSTPAFNNLGCSSIIAPSKAT